MHQAPRQGGDISLACVRKGFFLVTCFLLLVTSVAPVSCVFFLALRCIVADCFSSVLSSCVSALLMLVVVFRRWPTGLERTHPTYRISCMYLVASGLAQESRAQTARQGEIEGKEKKINIIISMRIIKYLPRLSMRLSCIFFCFPGKTTPRATGKSPRGCAAPQIHLQVSLHGPSKLGKAEANSSADLS